MSRLDFYFQFTFQIQLPKLFDLSPCLLTRKRTLGLLSWELGAHVERLAQIHIPAKFSHTKGPAREKRKDESSSRQDFKGRAAAPGPAQAPPSAYIRRGSRAGGLSALPPCAGPCPEGGWRGSRGGAGPKGRDTASAPPPPPAARGPSSAKLKRLRKVFRKERKDCHVQPTRRAVLWPVHLFQFPLHSILGIPPSKRNARSSARVSCSRGVLLGLPSRSRAPWAQPAPLIPLRTLPA